MEEYKVLITTSGIGSRLGNLTKHTNKSLVRVGKKPALSYIIETYPENVELIITLGYFSDHVRQFIRLAYPNRKITFVEIDNFDKEGSSLGYSLLQAKNLLQCPFIFHASDSIFESPTVLPSVSENWIGVSERENFSEYRTVNKDSSINEKGSLHSNLAYIGLARIQDYELFWKSLEEVYQENPNNSSLSDCNAINKMGIPFKIFNFKNWLDVGNVAELIKARSLISDKFQLLDKEDESIFIFEDFVIKFFADPKICENRVLRADSLQGLAPKLLGSTLNFYKYEYAQGTLLSHCIDEKLLLKLLKWSSRSLWIERKNFWHFKDFCYDFYFKKTKSRIEKFQTENRLKDEKLIINGREIPSISFLLDTINVDWLCNATPSGFHGDFILDNILYDKEKNDFVLLDWRQDFSGCIKDGDIYYDLAKLNHNLIFNHDLIFKGLFHVSRNENRIECDILRSERLINCKEVFDEWLIKNDFDLKKVNVLTSLIWLSMSPLHDSKMGEFLYYFGILNLYKSLFVCNLNCS